MPDPTPRLIMRHPNGTVFRHYGTLRERLMSWRIWLWCWRHGYRPRIERKRPDA